MNLWLRSFAGCMLVISVVLRMTPDGKYVQYVRLFTGLLFILLLLEPVLKIGSLDLFVEERVEEFLLEQEQFERQFLEEGTPGSGEVEEVAIDGIEVEVTLND